MAQLSVEQVQQLVPLRLALEEAVRVARTAGQYRRGAAVVALDAVVERTAALIFVTSGRPLPKNGNFEDYLSGLTELLGSDWPGRVTLPALRAQRRARNAAQHEALEPASEYLPQWALATDRFVRTAIDTALHVDIHAVAISDAVNDEGLRALLVEAENALTAGDAAHAVRAAMGAYKDALRAWRQLKKAPQRPLGTKGLFDEALGTRVRALEAMAEATVFAADPGEAEWFARALTEGESQRGHHYFDLDDAQRVMAFAFSWIVDYEQSRASWVDNRAMRHAAASRLVRTRQGPAHIARHEVRTESNGHQVIEFTLADVPSSDYFDGWMVHLQDMLARSTPGGRWRVAFDGTVKRWLETADTTVAADATRTLVGALGAIETELAAQEAERQHVIAALEATQIDHRAALSSESYPEWVEEVDWSPAGPGEPGPRWRLTAIEDIPILDIREWIINQPGVSFTYGYGSHELFIGPATTPQRLREILETADPSVQDALVAARERVANQASIERAISLAVHETLIE